MICERSTELSGANEPHDVQRAAAYLTRDAHTTRPCFATPPASSAAVSAATRETTQPRTGCGSSTACSLSSTSRWRCQAVGSTSSGEK